MSKILFILHYPPPVHGAAMVGQFIKESELVNSSFNCKFINLTTAKDIKDIGRFGLRKLKDFLHLIFNVIKQVQVFKPDICYITPNSAGAPFYKDLILVLLLKLLSEKVVIHFHNKGVATRQNKFIDNILYGIFFKNVKVILLDDVLYKDIEKYVKIENVYFCANGIPSITKQEKSFDVEKQGVNILFLSNMMKAKGVWTLLNVCGMLKERKIDFVCNFVGKWSDIDEKDFIVKCKDLDLDTHVIAHGAKYGDEKSSFYSDADILVYPTHSDCFPIVLLEAMQFALPCIASREGAIEGIVENGKTGFVVQQKNEQEFYEKIIYLIDNPLIRQQMGIAGKEKYTKEYTIEIFEHRIVGIFKQLLTD